MGNLCNRNIWLCGLAVSAVLCACGTTPAPACSSPADCASGVCHPDGSCAPLVPDASAAAMFSDAAADGAWRTVDAGSADAGDGSQPADAGAGSTTGPGANALGGCQANHDGTVSRSEVPVAAGLQASWRAAAHAPVDLKGAKKADGTLQWDLAGTLPGDHALTLATLPVTGAWYAAQFPGATYAARLNEDSELLGVFEANTTALTLRGVVSPQDGLTRTLLKYDPPVPVMQFPMTTGTHWQQTSTVTGQAVGILAAYSETWNVTVDAAGLLLTPLGTFEVLRARVALDQTIGLLTTHRKSLLFIAECFGTVAAIDAESGETKEDFTTAATIRRMAP